ncbi:hypothetical protein NEUTE2DRAFT_99730 [Neurospora tetrasperma FGSC 2509]|nr:hypothetical protein NEUTE2DRAFT_99730 [Neurospora tetrasperma FGSC 2509]
MSRHNSVSTTSSGSSGRASISSEATSTSSVSSQNTYDINTSPSVKTALSVLGGFKINNQGAAKPQGPYWCIPCNVSFQRKVDWMRHEDEFHDRHKRYPCPDCNSIFWGANTFNQHHKNAHGCRTCPHAEQVVRYTQRRTAWACGFCGAFMGASHRFVDHVAKHYEDNYNKAHWNHSLVIYGLLHQPVVHQAWKELFAQLYGHMARDEQPILGWDAQTTGHAQGFLEGQAPGKLQDLLEFFKGGREEAKRLARLSHDQAIIRSRQGVAITAIRVPVPKRSTVSTESLRHKSILQQQQQQQQFDRRNSATSGNTVFPQPRHHQQQQQHQQQHQQVQPEQEPTFQKQRSFSLPFTTTTTTTITTLTQFPNPPTNKYSHLHSHSLKFSLPVGTIYETPDAASTTTTVDFFKNTLAATATMTATSNRQHQLDLQDQQQQQQQQQNRFTIPPLNLSKDGFFDNMDIKI